MFHEGSETAAYAGLLADRGLKLCLDPRRGRCVVATVAFKRGDVAFRSGPLATSVFLEKSASVCGRCLQRFGIKQDHRVTGLRCGACRHVYYCGQACQRADWPLHKAECRHLDKYISECLDAQLPASLVCNVLLAFRCLRRHAERSLECDDDGVIMPGFDDVLHMCFTAPLTLLPGDSLPQPELFGVVEGIFAMGPTALYGSAPAACRTPEFLVGLLGRFQCNNFAYTDDLLDPVAAAVFPYGALLNHSCEPNCVLMHENGQQVVRILTDIQPGEELVHSYLDVCSPTSVRRNHLMETFGFECICRRCVEVVAVGPRMQVVSGHTPSGFVNLDLAMISDKSGKPCRPLQSIEGISVDLIGALDLYHKSLIEEDVDNEIALLKRAFNTFDAQLHPLNLDRYTVLGALASLCLLRRRTDGEKREAIKLHREIVKCAAVYYNHVRGHPLLGLFKITLSELLEETEPDEARREANEALEICLAAYGAESLVVKSIMARV